jgi:ABC-type transport system involved in cytochrome c biogenesis permease subunit
MNGFSRLLPGIVVGLAGAFILLVAYPPPSTKGTMDLAEFGKLPVMDNGRIKPIDSVARVNLLLISGRQTFADDKKVTQPATKWLLDVLVSEVLKNYDARAHKVFRIENDQVLDLLDLPRRPGFYRYSIDEIANKIDVLIREAMRAKDIDAKQRTVYDAKLLELHDHLQRHIALTKLDLRMVPPAKGGEDWIPLKEAMQEALAAKTKDHPATPFLNMLVSYADNRPEDFNRAVLDQRKRMDELAPKETTIAGYEAFFNHFDPFFWCSWLYVGVFALACMSWMVYAEPLRRSAFWLAFFTLSVHTYALVSRMVIQGRPPVTNLYSSAVFIGWAAIVIALILEAIFRNGLGCVVAAVLGFATNRVAIFLAENQGDTLEMMEAVLDTNFWLSTHVTVITFGYAAAFVAGIIGAAYLLLGVATPWLTREIAKALSQMMYGVVCFAMLLSFLGTVLGGIWADQSWGRFWGWDPKENGALILVIWNALILHARWSGLAKQRGVAILAVLGGVVTAWSWFGTNQLGVGLHSYGFSKDLAAGLRWFWLSQMLIVAVGLIPTRLWRSDREALPVKSRDANGEFGWKGSKTPSNRLCSDSTGMSM